MVLNADDVRFRWHAFAALTTRLAPELEGLALISEPFVDGAHEVVDLAVVLVIAFVLFREKGVGSVVEVVAPDAVQSEAALAAWLHIARRVLIGFGHQRHFAVDL